MCGIIAIFGDVDPRTAQAMLHSIAHRGPDDQAMYELPGPATLGIQRPSIMDTAHGRQPIVKAAAGLALVCNGEIYNHQEIRAAAAAGDSFDFASGSDVETVAYLYEKYGVEMLPLLDGMFAFALYDSVRDDFLVGRDRFGIKPLYYVNHAECWIFASEVKAFLAAGCALDAMREVPPGCTVTRRGVQCWYKQSVPLMPSPEASTTVRSLLECSVHKHLQADPGIQVGVFLSGGLDSSVLAALASRHRPDIVAFTIGTSDSPDAAAARRVAQHLGIRLVECPLSLDNAYRRLREAVRVTESYNAATVLEGLLTMMISEAAASENVKVVLSGEGADEIFAGYGFLRDLDTVEMTHARQTLLANIGSTECKRLDRATMAYSIEARVPFLDPALVSWVMGLPSRSLVRETEGRKVEKWILRDACSDLLPHEIVWRRKLAYDTGSGVLGLLARMVAGIDESELETALSAYPDAGLSDKLSLYLFREWQGIYGQCGGRDKHSMFGAYPLMDPFLTYEAYQYGGTGESDVVMAGGEGARAIAV